MISVHNVPYALKCIRHVFPYSESGPNIDTCPSISLIRLPHFPDHADLLRKQAGTGTG